MSKEDICPHTKTERNNGDIVCTECGEVIDIDIRDTTYIKREEFTKEVTIRKLREDPEQALQESLAHTINVVAKPDTNIVTGKVGRTTSTFYSSAGDGFIGYYRNIPIILAGKKVNTSKRPFIEAISKAIITARRSPNSETLLEQELIFNLKYSTS